MVVLLKKQDLTRKRKIIKPLPFVVMLGLLFSLVLFGVYDWAADFPPTNQTSEDTHPTIGPQSASVILNNGLLPSEALTAPLKYTVSTDGENTYAINSSAQLVYGGPSDSGGVDGASAAAVINAAVTSLGTAGGRIEVAAGEYLVNSKISLGDKVGLSCAGGARFTLGYNGPMFEFAGVSDAALTGAEIYGNRDNYAGTPIVLKDNLGVGSSHNTVANNHIAYSGNRGISIENALSNFNNVSFNVVEDVAKEGIMISRSSYNLAFGNVVKNTGSHGIISTGGSYNQIINNAVENAGGNFVSGFAHGIAVDGNHGLNACYGVVVFNNTVNTAYMAGIEVADGAYYITVTNNYVTKSRESGIFFGGAFAASRNCIISQNTVYLCGTAGDQGILVSGVSTTDRTWNVSVIDNVVDTAGVDGIRIKWVTDGNVTGNVCHGCGGYGLAFEDSNTDCILIANNDLRLNALGSLNLNRVNFGPVSSDYSKLSSLVVKQNVDLASGRLWL